MKIIFAGIIGRYPWGGVTWCSLMYIIGLRQLGHEVYYLEDTSECNYDPEINSYATDPSYAIRYIDNCLRAFDFGQSWCYVDYRGLYHGTTSTRWKDICSSADMLLVLSGGVWSWRDEYLKIPRKVFIDSDPGFTQIALQQAVNGSADDPGKKWYVDFFRQYDLLFTFGKNIGKSNCTLPDAGWNWLPTVQPVCMDIWDPSLNASRNVWSTVMTWKMESFKDVGGNKDQEFGKILDLPNLVESANIKLELAVNGPMEFLQSHNWQCIDAFTVSSDPWKYRDYIGTSRGEFSVAKRTYVATNCGWFSDRTACYLATGRPAVVQDTGFTSWLPSTLGLLPWTTAEEAADNLRRVEKDYTLHSAAARNIAIDNFSSDLVLKQFLDTCFS